MELEGTETEDKSWLEQHYLAYNNVAVRLHLIRAQELCESRGGRPGLPSL